MVLVSGGRRHLECRETNRVGASGTNMALRASKERKLVRASQVSGL